MTSYGVRLFGQNLFRSSLDVFRHQTIIWTYGKVFIKKCILKYRPQNGAHFAHASMSLECVRVISEIPQCVKYLTMHHFGTEYIRACTFLLQNGTFWNIVLVHYGICVITLIARFMGPTWDPPVSCRSQVGLILAPWSLLSGKSVGRRFPFIDHNEQRDRGSISFNSLPFYSRDSKWMGNLGFSLWSLEDCTHVATLQLQWPLKRKCHHFDEIFVTGCTESCHFDNFRCSQWWKFHQNDDIFVSVGICTFWAVVESQRKVMSVELESRVKSQQWDWPRGKYIRNP